MRLRIAEPEIVKENPFLNDKLDRKQGAVVLTQLFSSIEGPFVMTLNSTWGTGKTVFIKMLRQHLFNEGFPSFYFNAWDTDYYDNPLIAIIGEISSGIDELKEQGFETDKARKVYKKLKKTGKEILKKTIPVAVKTAPHGALEIEKRMEDAFSEFTSGVLENQIKNFSVAKDQVIKFKEQLRELVADLQKDVNSWDTKSRPLVFFIDELDRCRPEYLIQFLKKIRYYFDVDGIIFVLGVDLDQLGYSVKTLFGQNMKERGYLRKFFDLEYSLPGDNYTTELYCGYLSSETAITGIINKNPDHEALIMELKYSAMIMASSFSLSLRDLNILFNSVYLVLSSYESLKKEIIALSVMLITLKMRNPSLFGKIINMERSVYYVLNELAKMKKPVDPVKEYDRYFIERRFASLSLKKITDEEYRQQLRPNTVPGSNELNRIFQSIKDKDRLRETEIFTDTLFNRIKLLDSLKFTR